MKSFRIILIIVLYICILLLTGCDDQTYDVPWKPGDRANPSVVLSTKEETKTIDASGGEFEFSNSDIGMNPLKISVPEGALEKAELFRVKRFDYQDIAEANYNSMYSLSWMSPVYELNSATNSFLKDVIIEIPYLDRAGVLASDIKPVYYRNDKWNEIETFHIDTEKKVAVVRVDHFTPYALKYSPKRTGIKEFGFKDVRVSGANDFIHIECLPKNTGMDFFNADPNLLTYPYAQFEMITMIRLRRKISATAVSSTIVREKQYHNAVLINIAEHKALSHDTAARFYPWNFGQNVYSTWFGYNGFSGPYDDRDTPLGFNRYQITVDFAGDTLRSVNFKKMDVVGELKFDGRIVTGDFNNVLFKVADDFISFDDLRTDDPDLSSEYYFEIYSVFAEAGSDKYCLISTYDSPFTVNAVSEKTQIIEEPGNSVSKTSSIQGLAANAISSSSFTATWTSVADAEKYNVYLNGEKYAAVASNSIEIVRLKGLTTYTIEISAVSSSGEGVHSDPISVTTLENNPPVVSGVSAETGSGDITVMYDLSDKDDDNSSIKLYYSLDSGETWVYTNNIAGTVFNIESGVNHTVIWRSAEDVTTNEYTVEVKIVANDGQESGEGGVSDIFSLNIPEITDIITVGTSNEVTITYSLSYAAADIAVYYSIDTEENFIYTENLSGKTKSISPGGGKTIVWVSERDVYEYSTNVRIKIVPIHVRGVGIEGKSGVFTLENSNGKVEFADSNLEDVIREAISRPTGDILQADLEELTELSASSLNISDISGLEYCSNLKIVDFSINYIENLTPLSSLKKLESINLEENIVSDVTPIQYLENLEELNLNSNQITDVSALSELTALTKLSLSNNQLSDVEKLSLLTSLTELDLSYNEIIDISSFEALVRMQVLNLGNNNINRIEAISSMTGLTALYLYSNQIDDLTDLSGLQYLTYLSVYGNTIPSILPVSTLINLREFWAANNLFSDLTPLAELTGLQKLSLGQNQISDISVLENLENIDQVYLNNNQITDILPIVNNRGIENGDLVHLGGNDLTDTIQQGYITELEDRGVIVYSD